MTAPLDEILLPRPGEAPVRHAGFTDRQTRDLAAVALMLIGAALLLGALAAVDIRLAVGVAGVLTLAAGVALGTERAPGGSS